MAARTKISASLVEQFVSVTGASKAIAKSLLEACNGNLEMAIEMHLDSCEGPESGATSSNSSATCTGSTLAAGSSSNSHENVDDDVRAPIPQMRGILVEPYQAYPTRKRQATSVFDAFRDFQAEARQQEGASNLSLPRGKKKTLHDLFRPPIDLLHKGTFETAKLNRDVWSNDAVRNIIKERFVLWQVYRDSNEGDRFIQFYHVTSYPYLAVLDPRTAAAFLLEHPSLEGETPPAKKRRSESIVDASEDSQLRAAIAASLACTTSETKSDESDDDDDFDDLEFSESDSEEERKTPQKNVNKSSAVVKKEAKREINFGESADKAKGTCNEGSKLPHSKHLKSTDSAKKKNTAEVKTNVTKTLENSETGVSETDSKSEGKDDSSNQRTQAQAGPMCNIMVRFPNGSRTHMSLSAEASLKELVLLVQKEGYPNERYELVTNFPRRKLSCLDFGTTLKSAGLFPQETCKTSIREDAVESNLLSWLLLGSPDDGQTSAGETHRYELACEGAYDLEQWNDYCRRYGNGPQDECGAEFN
ncbi:UBX domain-containing protein 7 [Desmophyllum pertusum]|uniref:UBX domain-containing protein 7 n=1 Tax=Desmophyllum pertusum TaxID=174260 RepID=A0A9W9YEB0_9CNID|nr:UBX domain-containing protein 7 [Desmophyllum pertusum]